MFLGVDCFRISSYNGFRISVSNIYVEAAFYNLKQTGCRPSSFVNLPRPCLANSEASFSSSKTSASEFGLLGAFGCRAEEEAGLALPRKAPRPQAKGQHVPGRPLKGRCSQKRLQHVVGACRHEAATACSCRPEVWFNLFLSLFFLFYYT